MSHLQILPRAETGEGVSGQVARLLGYTNLCRGANRIIPGGGKAARFPGSPMLGVGPDEIRQRAYLDTRTGWPGQRAGQAVRRRPDHSRGLPERQDSGRCSQPRSGRSVRGQRGPRAADEGLPGPVTPNVGLL